MNFSRILTNSTLFINNFGISYKYFHTTNLKMKIIYTDFFSRK